MFDLNDYDNNNKNKKDYFILIDEQGTNFLAGVVFETLEEILEQFKSYADSDEMEDPTLKGWSIGDLMAHWGFTLKFWCLNDFIEVKEHDRDCQKRNILSYTA